MMTLLKALLYGKQRRNYLSLLIPGRCGDVHLKKTKYNKNYSMIENKTGTIVITGGGISGIKSALDLAGSGVVQAAEESENPDVRVTTGFSAFPDSPKWVTSTLFKPSDQIVALVKEVEEGNLGGAIKLAYGLPGTGAPRTTYLPLMNVPDEINEEVTKVAEELEAGNVEVVKDFTPME